ncbi:MAG: thiosulfate oxidation carrier protein SoxY, partial [Gammaproteobacteria bacterium]|nr:thiosulfate oxidation carrier protein SoxY [Gammaproteobacteria bacterium]
MTQYPRRTFLKNSLATAVLVTLGGAGLLSPHRALAADWPKDAFTAKKLDEALTALFGSAQTSPSASI